MNIRRMKQESYADAGYLYTKVAADLFKRIRRAERKGASLSSVRTG